MSSGGQKREHQQENPSADYSARFKLSYSREKNQPEPGNLELYKEALKSSLEVFLVSTSINNRKQRAIDKLLPKSYNNQGILLLCPIQNLKVKNIAQHGRYWSEKRVFTVYTQRENISPEHFVEGLKL